MSTARRSAARPLDPAREPLVQVAPPGTAPGVDPDVDPISILIVDDEPANLVVLETILDDAAYRLVRARSADEALMALVRQDFALLILDIRMPEMDGIELAQMIKKRRRTAGIPIIFLTAYYDQDQQVLEGYGSGAVDFLSKPVNATVLRSKVSVFADLHRKSRAAELANRALINEIEERKRAEEQLRALNASLEQRVIERTDALRAADRQLREMMGSITDGLLMLDRDWRFSYVNEQGARLLGRSAEALLGTPVADLVPHALSERSLAGYRRAIDRGETHSFEELFAGPVDRWFQCHCYPSEAGLSVYFLNISERREAETRRDALLAAESAARTEGERLARAKDEFLASLSHELRTPLSAIVGWATTLQRETGLPATTRRGIDVVARNARARTQLVADLLDVSRIVAGKLRMAAEPVNLNQTASLAADSSRLEAEAKGVLVEAHLGEDAPWIVGDPDRLYQVASNLIGNAIKFTPAGGTVRLSTSVSGDQAQLEVTDTGEGIAPAFLPHLFERFSQADSSAARVHGGLGLGLSIVQSLVEVLGGTVGAHSEGVGRGSSFVVRFPLAPAPTPAVDGPEPHAPAAEPGPDTSAAEAGAASLRGISLLLVDDNPDVLEIERRMLSENGAEVTVAATARQALQLLQARSFQLLLSDLGMPGMDGYTLIRTVRTGLGIPAERMPAIAVTAFVRDEDRALAVSEGFQAVIQKPLGLRAATRTILDHLDTRHVRAAHVDAAPPPASSADRRQAGTAPRLLRALYVEDNLDLQEQIGSVLEGEGMELVICATGEAALEAYRPDRFDLVITDVGLPGMSGVDLARAVLARSPAAWVVFLSGYAMGEAAAGFGPHVRSLLKPFEFEDLERLVQDVRASLNLRR